MILAAILAASLLASDALPPRTLDARSVENLVAFARLYGLVRFFSPSDEAAAADWPAIAVEGARLVEDAPDGAALQEKLGEIFRPLAPTMSLQSSSVIHCWCGLDAPLPAGTEIVSWVHRGVGLDPAMPVYSSRRERRDGGGSPLPFVEIPLGGGTEVLLPIASRVNGGATTPRADRPQLPALAARSAPTPDDRATRLGAVVIAWNVLRHFYPYDDVVPCDWDGMLERALRSAAADADAVAFLATLRRLVAEIHDGHGTVTHPADLATSQPKLAWEFVEGKLVVTHVAPDAGEELRPGDVVVSVDGVPISDAIAREIAMAGAATPQLLRVRVARQLLHGPPGSEIAIGVERDGAPPRVVKAPRSIPRMSFAEPRPEKVAEIAPGVLYCDLGRVRDADFAEALPRLAAAKGVVFDLRGYPRTFEFLSHLSKERLESPRWEIPLVTRPFGEGRTFASERWTVEPVAPRLEGRVAFLTDGRAISAAETCLGMVEAYELGEIVGSPTAGTNGNVNPIALPGGYSMTWTGMRVLKHDGSRLHGVGVLPTVPVERTIRGVAAGKDEVLERAIEIVRG